MLKIRLGKLRYIDRYFAVQQSTGVVHVAHVILHLKEPTAKRLRLFRLRLLSSTQLHSFIGLLFFSLAPSSRREL